MVKVNVLTLKPLHVVGKLLGIWPAFNVETMQRGFCPYLYGGIVLTLFIIQYICSEYGKIWYRTKIDDSVFVTMLLSDFLTTLTNITSIININFIQGKRLRKFVHDLRDIDMIMKHVKIDESNNNRNFYIELALGHILFLVYMGYNAWNWVEAFGWSIGKYSLMRDLQFYHIFITAMIIRNYVLLIKYKLEALNYVLENHNVDNLFMMTKNFSACSKCSNGAKSRAVDEEGWDLDFVGKMYTRLANAINEINEIFGWNLVVLEVQLIINMLLPLNLALVYGDGEKIMGVILDYNLLILCFLWFIAPFIQMITVIAACDKAKKEANKMPMICYNLIMENKDDEYVNRLKELATQGSIQSPGITAAGFFNLDYSLIFPTMTSIISYVIVLIQFRE